MLNFENTILVRSFRQMFDRAKFLRSVFTILFSLGIFAVFIAPVYPQSNVTGGFEGRVTDGEGGPGIPNAIVRFINPANGYQTARKTNADGYFQQDFLTPGIYTIKVEVAGFKLFEKSQELYATRSNRFLPIPIALEKIGSTTVTPTPTPVTTTTGEKPVAGSDADAGADLNPRRDGAFNNFLVSTLPLGGTTLTRTFDELAFFVMGVNPAPLAIGNTVGPGVGGGVGTSGQFSVNGLRSRANNFTVDGSDNNDEDIGVRRQGFFTLVPQPIESIQEFQIITLLAPAQYGRNMGAQVNAISKQGGNNFRGSVFGLLSFDRFNAPNFFDNTGGDYFSNLQGRRLNGNLIPVFVNGQQRQEFYDAGEKDVFTLLQGGFAVGGRLVKDKMFFFVSGEGQSLDATQEKNFAVPTVEERGLFGSGASGLTTGGGAPVFPTSLDGDAVFSVFPFPNNPNGIYGRNTYTQSLSADAKGLILSGRFDWNIFKINGNQQIFTARYNFTDDERDLTDVGGALFSQIRPLVRTDNFSTFLVGSLTNNVSNEFRFSWGRTQLEFEEIRDATGFNLPVTGFGGIDNRFLLNTRVLENWTLPNTHSLCVAGTACYLNFNETTALNTRLGPIGQLIVAGFSPVGVDVFNFPQERENNTYQFADTVRWQLGNHAIAFGGDIRRTFLDSNLPRNSRPLVTFNGGLICNQFNANGDCVNIGYSSPLDLAASGAPSGFFQSLVLPGQNAEISLGYYQLNFFLQDDWRVRNNLTISVGLRYELNTTPKEANNKIENSFAQSIPNFLRGLRDFIAGRTNIYDSDKNNFAPRIGIAYSPSSKTVIRGGFGMYYDQILGAVVSQSRNVFPTFTTVNFGGGVLIDNPIFGTNNTFLGNQFTLFNPLFAIFDPTTGFVCNRRDRRPACNLTNSIPLISSGSLNTFNFNQQQLNLVLNDIYLNFPFDQFGNPFGATIPTRALDTPLSYQYSFGIEHRIFKNTFLSAAYVGTSGRSLLRFATPNLGTNYIPLITGFAALGNVPIVLGNTNDPTTTFANNRFVGRPNRNVGPISQFETTGRSRYDALQIGLRGRFTQDFQYQLNYVFGSVKDDVSDVFDLAGAFSLPQNSQNFAGEYAPANFDVRHRFTYNFVYDLPLLKSQGDVVEFFFGGWQIAGTGKFNTGQPFTVNSIFDINLDGNLTDRLNSTQFITVTGDNQNPLTRNCTPAQCQSMLAPIGRDGSVPRNSFRAANLLELDLSFAKRWTFRETHSFQLRVDVFNFINRANFGIPVRFLEAPGFGSANDTVTPGRRIQFGLKYSF